MTPRAIIFDYGNVLSRPQGEPEVHAMAALLELPLDRFRELYWRYRLAYDQALFEPLEYWRKVAPNVTAEQLEELNLLDARSWAYADPVMPKWAAHARAAGFKTALLSNMPVPVRDYTRTCDWLPVFDQLTYSCDLRITKPSPEIYRHCLEGLGAAAGDALLLDDRPENVRGAEAIGMHGLLFTTPPEAARLLRERFELPGELIATLERADEENQ